MKTTNHQEFPQEINTDHSFSQGVKVRLVRKGEPENGIACYREPDKKMSVVFKFHYNAQGRLEQIPM
jgi:hypothetical protein